MKFIDLSVKRPVTILMMILIVMIIGFISLTKLPIDLYPNFEIPVAIVSTTYSGVGPQEMESLVTKPVENALGTVEGIKNVTSITSEGQSIVIAEFDFGVDMDFAALDMREKIDMVEGYLPEASSKPMVLKIDPNAQAIMELAIVGGNLERTQQLAEDELKARLERISGVASVEVRGGYEKEVRIELKDSALLGYGIDISTIAQILRAENVNMPGGTVERGLRVLTIRTVGQFDDLSDIQNLPIPLPNGQRVPLGEIADVRYTYKELGSILKTNGEPSIGISIQKQSGTNTVQVARSIKAVLADLKVDYPEYEILTSSDQSLFIEKAIANVTNSAIYGGLLAIVVLFVFLRNIRTTFIIGISIPVSIIATFILIYYQGITLNLMTLGGLALGIGMLVDNSIVVLENIYRFRQNGYDRFEAAILGAKEVGMAVTASTFTTLAVFLPITFVEGITSTIFRELALTVSFSLGASLVASLTLVPMLSSQLLHVDQEMGATHHGRLNWLNHLYDRFDKTFSAVERSYGRFLKTCLNHRRTTVLVAVVIFFGSLATIPFIGAEYFPAMDQGYVTIQVSLPTGSEIKDTNTVIEGIEAHLADYPDIEAIYASVGQSSMMMLNQGGTNTGNVIVQLLPMSQREITSKALSDRIRQYTKGVAGAKIQVTAAEAGFGGMSMTPIQITVKGFDLQVLKRVGDDLARLVSEVEGTREVESSFSEGIEEVAVKINREKARVFGLTATQISTTVQNAVAGMPATQLRLGDTEVDITVSGDAGYSTSIDQLKQLKLKTPVGQFVPLEAVAELSIERSPIAINRDDQARIVTITGQLQNRDLQSVTNDIKTKLASYTLPEDYDLTFGGQTEEMISAFSDLFLALILAIVIVYMVLAAQFESLIHPFTIILAVPLSFSGALFGLLLTGRTLNVPSFIGLIMLAGIVVNNAIVLVDYINTRRHSGEDRNTAILAAGPIRLRPILMTTLTTVLGLIPLALGIGEGAEAQAPLATVVIFGLALSTLLTLVLIPVVYTIFDEVGIKLRKKLMKGADHVEKAV